MERRVEPRLGEMEQLVLLALLRLGDDAYGVAVRRELERRTRRAATFGSVYTTLARLEAKGLITSALGEPTHERGGRRKRYFALRPAGRRAVAASLRVLRSMTHGLGPTFESP
jgi:DNA-binding PadR family transcriptional regulator